MGIYTKECDIMVKGEYILELYKWYKEHKITINRKYQRKLVWNLKEKQEFIDTILKNYPVPLFLVASRIENIDGKKQERKEIIDGLQRIEAIISFINNEFKVEVNGIYQYFNRSVYPGNEILLQQHKIYQKKPVIDSKICEKFLIYELPITTINADDTVVENIFKRINSTGRKLSSQDLRHAGVISKFSTLVSNSAMMIRGDVSENIIGLHEMSKYSLNSSGLNYGIDINNVFWLKQGIINEDGIRRSKDEEIIANLYNCILSDYSSGMSVKTLNRLYDESTDTYKKNENLLTPSRLADLENLLETTFDDLEKVFERNNTTFEKLLFKRKSCPNKDLVFIIIVLSIIQLKCENYIIEDYLQFDHILNNMGDDNLSELIKESSCTWNKEVRNRLIERVKNVLVKHMVFKENNPQWNDSFIELLKQKSVEGQMMDFKIGLHDLRNGHENESLIPKCIKTLIAMANTCPKQEGTIVIGVSDKESDAVDFEKYYSTTVQKYNDYYVPGINDEAQKFYGSIQKFLDFIRHSIEKEKVDSLVIHNILTTMDTMKYEKQTLLVLRLSTEKPLFYDGKLYVRYDSNNQIIKEGSNEYYEVIEKFYTAKDTLK